MTWEFDSINRNLIVTSSILNNGLQSVYLPLQSGNYQYTIIEFNGKTYLKIDNLGIHTNGEYGNYTISQNGILTIDQGEGSESSASDVFVLTFN